MRRAMISAVLFALHLGVAAGQTFSETVTPFRSDSAVQASEFGTADLTMITISEAGFAAFDSDVEWAWNDGRYLTTAGFMVAPLTLPAGAVVEAIMLEACDTNSSGAVILNLLACAAPPSTHCAVLGSAATSGTPGCVTVPEVLDEPRPLVDNTAFRYVFEFRTQSGDLSNRFRGARIFFRRQVSPTPETSSFADVPTGHPLHRYVEALAAAGITAGCGGGNFCPNDPITRGQMAVFLAKALGLHWAP